MYLVTGYEMYEYEKYMQKNIRSMQHQHWLHVWIPCLSRNFYLLLNSHIYPWKILLWKHQRNSATTSEPPVSPTGVSVIGEELHSKIEENARLHKQVCWQTDKFYRSHTYRVVYTSAIHVSCLCQLKLDIVRNLTILIVEPESREEVWILEKYLLVC